MTTGAVALAPVNFFVMLGYVKRAQTQSLKHISREKCGIGSGGQAKRKRSRRHCRAIFRQANQRFRQQNTRHGDNAHKFKNAD